MARKIHVLQPGGFYCAQFTRRAQAARMVAAGLAFWLSEFAVQMLRPGELAPLSAKRTREARYAHADRDRDGFLLLEREITVKLPPIEVSGCKFRAPQGFVAHQPRPMRIQCRNYSLERLPDRVISDELALMLHCILKP